MKIGLFFGSFNPIHIGHLIIANTFLENSDLDQIWFVVSPQNPLKRKQSLAPEYDRLYMVERAISDNFKMKACDIEFNMPKPSYTIDTLVRLQELYPQNKFALIIGEDNLVSFQKWKNYRQILDHFCLYVYPRPACEPGELKNHLHVRWVEAPFLDISATFIRSLIKNNKSVKYLLPEEVEGYIRKQDLYKS